MRIKHVKLYQFDELPTEEAKERAREWWREASAGDTDFAESVTDDFMTAAQACGFDLTGKHPVTWSGFSSQGDGAAFTGSWSASRVDIKALLADRPATYTDRATGETKTCESNAELAIILQAFASLAAYCPSGYGSAEASHRYNNMTCEWGYEDGESSHIARTTMAEDFKELCRDLAHWFYRSLEREYEYVNSAEYIDDCLRGNEYEFTEDGERA